MQRYIKLIVCGEILAMLALAIFIGYLIAAPSNKQRGRPVRRYVDTLVYVPSNQSDTKKHMWALDADVDVGKIIVALPVAAGDASGRASFGNIMTFKEFYDAKPFGKGRAVEYWLRIRDGETPATEDIAKEIRALRASGFNIRGVMIVDEVVKREPWWETIRAQNLKFGVLGSKGWTAGYPTATGVPQPDLAIGEFYEPAYQPLCAADAVANGSDAARQAAYLHANAVRFDLTDSTWAGVALGGKGADCPTAYDILSPVIRQAVALRDGAPIRVLGLWS